MENHIGKFEKYLTRDRQRKKTLCDILTFVMDRGESTRREIERETGFSWGSVSESVAELIQRGYLTERASDTRVVGRKTSVLALSGKDVVAIGVDVNTTALSAQVVGFDLDTKWEKVVPFCAKSQDEVLEALIELIALAVEEGKGMRIMGIGVAMQGHVESAVGTSVHFPGVGHWEPVDVCALIEARFGVPVALEHDPRCLIVAKTVRQKIKDGVLIRVDNGIGLAMIQDGVVLPDDGRLELGHTIAVKGGALCSCGRRGCLEAYSSIRGIERATGKSFCEIEASADKSVLTAAGEYLATAVYNLCMMFEPERVVLTGKLALNADFGAAVSRDLRDMGMSDLNLEFDGALSASFGAAIVAIRSAIGKRDI